MSGWADASVMAGSHQPQNASTTSDNHNPAAPHADAEKGRISPPELSRTNTSDEKLEHVNTSSTNNTLHTTYTAADRTERSALFDDNGQVIRQPAPTADPRDPINMTTTRKIVALLCLCTFGAMAAAAELILGAALPVFALVYANINPTYLVTITDTFGGFPLGSNPLAALQDLPGAYPITDIYLLASLPVLVIGLSNWFLVPLAVAVGRRPVLLGAGVIAIAGASWAGASDSLGTHIGARCLQAVGAGTVEALIPFIIQDMVFVHQRNTWISSIFAMQGLIIIAFGIASPYIIINLSWRWLYWITAIIAACFLGGIFFLMPETRWPRSKQEMDGIPIPRRPDHEYKPRTLAYDLALFHGKTEWAKAWEVFKTSVKTFFYPNIFFVTMLNSAMIAAALAAAYTVAPALLTAPWDWSFFNLGLALIPILVSAICVGLITGVGGDYLANYIAKKKGVREPEIQILNLILPSICAIVGCAIFGVAGAHQDQYPWIVFIVGLGLMVFGFLGANSVGAVYVLECYPHLTGTALVNIASVRAIIAFLLSFRVGEWVADLGYFRTMMIYLGLLAGFSLFLPVIYLSGAWLRKKFPY